ncbi:MAG: hypothetical protein KGZ77_04545 [Rhodobacteraceae bacterium]|nr:hypothetical protein [Paracoccaceae bacterium]
MSIPSFLPGVPAEAVLAALTRAPGSELASGKFDSPESSAALAVNAFGWFLDRPRSLPPLPGVPMGLPQTVAVEAELRFPWSGGRHPWLDAWSPRRPRWSASKPSATSRFARPRPAAFPKPSTAATGVRAWRATPRCGWR